MRQNKIRLYAHFVWSTWNRQPLITEAIESDLYRFIQGICLDHRCAVLAIGGMPDHVHLLVALSNTITVADLMEFVKGGFSRFVTERLLHEEWFKWQGSYGVFSVSPQDKNKVIRYIQNQKQHHADGTVWTHAEETFQTTDSGLAVVTASPTQVGEEPKAS